jgi:MoaA/NifB/PqqE/SkfB family radical SAM enzyme
VRWRSPAVFDPRRSDVRSAWEVTRFCNLLCDHCCTDSGPAVDRHAEPSTAVLVAAAAQLAEADITKVYFSGGEPLLRDGFLDLLDAIDTDRVRVHIASNGYHLDEPTIARLKSAGLAKLSVSLDGGDAKLHDRLRRSKGAFDRTVAGITRAVAAGLRVGVSVTVTPANMHSLDPLMDTLVSIGVPVASFHSVFPVGRASKHPELLLGAGSSQTFEQKIRDLEVRYGSYITFDHNFGPGGSRAEPGCPAQTRLLHIDPSGDVSPCSWLYKIDPRTYSLGNITHAALRDIVDSYCHALDSLLREESKRCPLPLAISLRSAS